MTRRRSAGARGAPELAPRAPISSPAPAPTRPRAIADVPPKADPEIGRPLPSLAELYGLKPRATLRMLDLFAGSGNASRAALVRGWKVVRIDNAPGTAADVRVDLATWKPLACEHYDLVWASPPCTQLSTANQKTRDVSEGLVLVRAALRIIAEVKPRWWVLENVHGATRAIGELIGPPVARYGSFYLWGNFPPFEANVPREKTKLSGRRRAERRAAIPWAISNGLICACEALAKELE